MPEAQPGAVHKHFQQANRDAVVTSRCSGREPQHLFGDLLGRHLLEHTTEVIVGLRGTNSGCISLNAGGNYLEFNSQKLKK